MFRGRLFSAKLFRGRLWHAVIAARVFRVAGKATVLTRSVVARVRRTINQTVVRRAASE